MRQGRLGLTALGGLGLMATAACEVIDPDFPERGAAALQVDADVADLASDAALDGGTGDGDASLDAGPAPNGRRRSARASSLDQA